MWSYGLATWTIGTVAAIFFIVPPVEGLGYLARIAFFHIPVAWVSVFAFTLSAWWAFWFLRTQDSIYDWRSASAAALGMLFCLLATLSGAVFAKLTWGAYWNWDPRQTSIFILLLIYGAYLALRASIHDTERRAKTAAVYALFSFLNVPFLVFIIPRYYFSLHPEPVVNAAGKLEMEWVILYVLAAAVVTATGIFWRLLITSVKQKSRNAEASKGADVE
jgi:heme exporter protein C